MCDRLDEASILALVPAAEAEDIARIFPTRKKWDPERERWTLRLLFDRRARNGRERHLYGASRRLPHGCCFCDVILEEHEELRIPAREAGR